MKLSFPRIVGLSALVLSALTLSAQDGSGSGSGSSPARTSEMPGMPAHVAPSPGKEHQSKLRAELVIELALTPEQQTKLNELDSTLGQKLKAVMTDQTLSPKDRAEKRGALVKEATVTRESILSPEQSAKFKAHMERISKERAAARQAAAAGQATPVAPAK